MPPAFEEVWSVRGTNIAAASPYAVGQTLDGHKAVYVSGTFKGTAQFPTGPTASTDGTPTSAGGPDIFLMALDQADTAPAAPLYSTATSSSSNDLALLSLMSDADDTTIGTTKKRF